MLQMARLSDAVKRASVNRSRLVFLPASLAEHHDLACYKRLDMNRLLAEQLINLPKQDRAKAITPMVIALIDEAQDDVLLMAGLEILFDRSLAIDPIRLLSACAKNKTLLVCWPGEKTAMGLSYATPSHPEYRNYKASDLSDAIFLTADAQPY